MGSVQIPLEALFGFGAFVVQLASLLAVLAIWGGRIDQRLKAVEGHSETVQRVGPLEAKFDQFERGMETRLEGIERALREATTAIQQLALAFARKAS